MAEFEQILVEQVADVVRITLNRPERLNAWTPKMLREMTQVITDANDDTAVGAIVVTGAGRGFCAGADIGSQFAAGVEGKEREDRPAVDRSALDWVQLCRTSKPLVAAINGACIGIGLTMVLPFDQIIAADDAKLSARFVKMGLVPELASSHFLVARCGFGAASWLALSGATILGDEAARLRLVDRAVPVDRVVDEAMAVAAELAANPPTQLRMIKELLSLNATDGDLAAVQRREGEMLNKAYKTPEHQEAVRAFLEKRPPVFR